MKMKNQISFILSFFNLKLFNKTNFKTDNIFFK
jgi:hypothetical protein